MLFIPASVAQTMKSYTASVVDAAQTMKSNTATVAADVEAASCRDAVPRGKTARQPVGQTTAHMPNTGGTNNGHPIGVKHELEHETWRVDL